MVNEQRIREEFPSFEQGLVAEMAAKADIRHFREGESLVKTGQHFRSTLLVLQGLVKIYREDEEGNEFFMYYLQPGQACALSMIAASRREASQIKARAMAETEALSIPLESMDRWGMEFKTWYHFVLDSYRARFDELLSTIDHIAFRNMDERLLFYLRKQVDTLKSSRLTISATEIASDLNSSREVISRLLKKLADRGDIRMDRNVIGIVRLDTNGQPGPGRL
ncbi:MAG TPA: Crp/Fnr family transcriptional regulator [Puia sp.]|nr:Crp/Fnr family transcriptional regulator [Puia sp.]